MGKYLLLQVQCDSQGIPFQIEYQRSNLRVKKVMEIWRDTGCWWEDESEKAFYRLLCHDGSIREIFLDLFSQQWFLYKIYD
jgi:hypothetical protein